MLESVISLLGGGITGVLGATVQRVYEFKSKKLDIELQKAKFENEIALRKVDSEIMDKEWAARVHVAEIEGASKADVADSGAFAAALTNEPKLFSEKVTELSRGQAWLMVLLDVLRGIVRPGLTLYLAAVTTAMYIKASHILNADMIIPEMAYGLVRDITQTVLYLFTTATLFYFGVRNKEKRK